MPDVIASKARQSRKQADLNVIASKARQSSKQADLNVIASKAWQSMEQADSLDCFSRSSFAMTRPSLQLTAYSLQLNKTKTEQKQTNQTITLKQGEKNYEKTDTNIDGIGDGALPRAVQEKRAGRRPHRAHHP
jgi:hypothetical protein